MVFNQKINDNYKVTDIFPLAFYEGKVSCHKELKELYYDEIRDYSVNCYKKGVPVTSFHNEEKYKIFFDSLRENFNQYMSVLGVDYTRLSFHVLKCWADHKPAESDDIADINENRYDIPFADPSHPHWHNHSDFTFVYYFNADETSDHFHLENVYANQNDPDALLELAREYNIFTEWNKYNTKQHIYEPEEGSIIIVPSKLYHFTRRHARRVGDRISIGGDVKVTSVPDATKQLQCAPHPSIWREI
jgi:hypothetical protein